MQNIDTIMANMRTTCSKKQQEKEEEEKKMEYKFMISLKLYD